MQIICVFYLFFVILHPEKKQNGLKLTELFQHKTTFKTFKTIKTLSTTKQNDRHF